MSGKLVPFSKAQRCTRIASLLHSSKLHDVLVNGFSERELQVWNADWRDCDAATLSEGTWEEADHAISCS